MFDSDDESNPNHQILTAVKLEYLSTMDFDDGDLKDIWDTDLDVVSPSLLLSFLSYQSFWCRSPVESEPYGSERVLSSGEKSSDWEVPGH